VVARPGDQVEVRGGELYRNGTKAFEPWLAEPMHYNFGPVTVPAGCLLVLGDNRNASLRFPPVGALTQPGRDRHGPGPLLALEPDRAPSVFRQGPRIPGLTAGVG
jgi:hypothetical protein